MAACAKIFLAVHYSKLTFSAASSVSVMYGYVMLRVCVMYDCVILHVYVVNGCVRLWCLSVMLICVFQ